MEKTFLHSLDMQLAKASTLCVESVISYIVSVVCDGDCCTTVVCTDNCAVGVVTASAPSVHRLHVRRLHSSICDLDLLQ